MSSNDFNSENRAADRPNGNNQDHRLARKSQRNQALTSSVDSTPLDQFYDLNATDGIIVRKLSSSRLFLLNSDTWSDVEKEMIQVFSSAGYVILDKIGHAYGSSFARRAMSESKLTTFGTLQSLALVAGWGKVTVYTDEKEGSWIRVVANDCVFCHGSKNDANKNECMFLSGVIRGMAEEFYKRNYAVSRNQCSHSEPHACEILLEETTNRARH